MSWPAVSLGDVCGFVRGPFGGSLKKEIFKEDGFAVFEQQHAINNQFSEIRYFVDEAKFNEMKRFELQPGELIMSCSGTMGKVAIAPQGIPRGIINQALLKISPQSSVDVDYLLYWMESDDFQRQLEAVTSGAAIKNVASVSILKELKFPLPSLEEQRRIAGILDQADALRRLRTRALDKLNTLGQAIFHEMFGDVVSNEMSWAENEKLGDHADIASGITKGRKIGEMPTRPIAYMAVSNVQDQHLKMDVVKEIDATEDEIARYRLQACDLLLTEGGDPDKLGRGSLWNDELSECIHQNHIFRVRVKSGSLSPLFLQWLVASQRGKQFFFRSAKQTTGIASINKSQLKEFPLILPPVNLQKEFEKRMSALSDATKLIDGAFTMEAALFASLQHRAFRGEL